ncbi:MAG: bifunctional phosphopantothenoylcysteine decarboxylase/phosphopantothenate--cysteine ligase CoaBC [Lachnospiraceae bacterium]|nr:bifunctional phosphopantothenoylcysteine decarboxylase/phosphopantothenate--cysteine ligase CoaBC [Lachnospiraceae bacterium]
MLKGKTVVLGVSGGIAAYKMVNVASMLVKLGAEVHVIMTENAKNFINPIAFETITKTKCLVDTFDRNFQFNVAHVSLGQKADVMLIAPATANIIGKMANGIADDMLSTVAVSATCKKIVSPAMNTYMFRNPIVQDNIEKLKRFGFEIIEPGSGMLACGDVGEGRLPEESVLVDYIVREIAFEKDLAGKKILITAGPTREAIDPVRYITNHSTGKMGCALAKIAMLRGADVTLVAGPISAKLPPFVKVVNIVSAKDMFEAVTAEAPEQDIIIKSAAVADYRPAVVADEKMKKKDGDLSIEMERTDDILAYLGAHKKEGQLLCGFSMETQSLIENSTKKLEKKNADMIVANSLKDVGAGFGTDTNIVTLITKERNEQLPIMSKEEVAGKILDKLVSML